MQRPPRPHLPALPAMEARVRAEAENRPGVYQFRGPRGEVLYVGKSVRVRDRLLAWLRSREGKGLELLRVSREVEWAYLPGEFDALLEEFRAIRVHRPRFNVVHRRSRRFAWIRLTDEPAPRLVATLTPGAGSTRRGARRGERLFGPFPAQRALPRVLKELARSTGLRDCAGGTPIHFADQQDLLGGLLPSGLTPACPRAELGSCPGPCAALCSEDRYRAGVREAVAFLEGRSDAPLERLDLRMAQAAGAQAFERAARLRDRRERLESLRRRLVETARELASLTFVYHPPSGDPALPGRHHLLREGQLLATVDEPTDPGARSRAAHLFAQALRRPAASPATLGEGDREGLFLVANWFRSHPQEKAHGTPVEAWLAAMEAGEERRRGPLSPGGDPAPGWSRRPPVPRAGPRGASG